uniref:Polyglutamine-binding protein 1-like n=1 Tax=Dermatophagoides pteronyssinus TaxID=6956 RepID=A0A6P6XXU1_DERPT|nr:polyglutamine-binding protein 1-like [Dermatophagoides pteronyssinus]
MSKLPPALAARLAKRGLLEKPLPSTIEHEEVIAEDYDETPKQEFIQLKTIDTVIGCPNKYNIYHNCTSFCAKKYADVRIEPNKRIRKIFAKLLKKYPLKDSVWEQVYEPGLQTFYFWNTETDQVSWLPPNHPDAKISISAEKLRRLVRDDHNDDENESSDEKESTKNDSNDDENDDDDDDDDDDSDNDNSDDEDEDNDSDEPKPTEVKKLRRMVENRNRLDPMDPASYSDIPRGKWSDGLR